MSQERLDYAVIASKPLPYNHIGLDFVHTVSPSQVGRPRVQPPTVNSVRRKRSALEGIRLVIKCSSLEVTYVISAHTYGPELYIKGGQRAQISSYVFIYYE